MKYFSVGFFLFFTLISIAQTGGFTAFNFLNLNFNARSAGLGAGLITVRDGDVNLGIQNPALFNEKMSKKISISQGLYAGGTNIGSLVYGRQLKNKITGSVHFRYVAYGKMDRTDINGTNLGTFSPGDFVLGISAAKSINERLHIGATLNTIYSQLDNYTAFGNSIDIGGCFTNEPRRLVISGVVKNLGIQWKNYNGLRDSREDLPLQIQAGISHRLAHAPFRFSLLARDLQKWDLTYQDPNLKDKIDPLTGDTTFVKKAGFFEKTARHLVVQTELLFGEKFHLRVGFNYQRRQELKLTERPGIAGFSFGAGLYLKRFTLDYGILAFSAAGAQHQLSLTVPIR